MGREDEMNDWRWGGYNPKIRYMIQSEEDMIQNRYMVQNQKNSTPKPKRNRRIASISNPTQRISVL